MREFKFRAWKDSEKKMIGWEELIDQDGYAQYLPDIFEAIYLKDLMQFTGLLDKNGKEIYEGDVVNIYYWLNGEIERTRKDVVEFNYGKFDFKNPIYRETLQGSDREIIGNIHENPDLLTNP